MATQLRKEFTQSPKRRARRQGVVTRPKLACLDERGEAAASRATNIERFARTRTRAQIRQTQKSSSIDVHPNGGAKILHVYYDDNRRILSNSLCRKIASKFVDYVMGVVHDALTHVPYPIFRPPLRVRQHSRSKYDVENARRIETHARVCGGRRGNVPRGNVSRGALNKFSLIGKVSEEMGGYFRDVILAYIYDSRLVLVTSM